MRINIILCLAVTCFAWTASECQAADATYILSADGLQVVPVAGDPDGSATGTISLDDVTGDVSWNFSYSNIATLTAMHIHGPGGAAGSGAGPIIGLGVATSGGAGTLIGNLTAPLSDITSILNDPTDFYVQIHDSAFAAGTVRGQLGTLVPEPTAMLLLAYGLVCASLNRRR